MGKSITPLARHKRLVRAGEVALTPRKEGFLHAKVELEHLTGPMLAHIRSGCGPKTSAEAAGVTHDELRYLLQLGEMGHPAWRRFHDEWLRAWAGARAGIERNAYEFAACSDPEVATDARIGRALALMDPDEHGERARRSGGDGGVVREGGGLQINVITGFPEPERVEVIDVEGEEVTDG